MIDLNYFVKHYNPWSPHHIAAFNELAKHLPKEQLETSAEWVTIYKEELNEWRTDELSF